MFSSYRRLFRMWVGRVIIDIFVYWKCSGKRNMNMDGSQIYPTRGICQTFLWSRARWWSTRKFRRQTFLWSSSILRVVLLWPGLILTRGLSSDLRFSVYLEAEFPGRLREGLLQSKADLPALLISRNQFLNAQTLVPAKNILIGSV